MKLRALLALAAMACAASPAMAQAYPPERSPLKPQTYVAVSVGGIAFSSASFELSGPDDLLEIDTREGEAWSVAIGIAEGPVRGEIQYANRRVDIENISASGVPLAAGGGEVELGGLYLNGYYDFETGAPLVPYLGFGIGGAFVDAQAEAGGAVFFDEADTVFSAQLMAGASLRLGPNAELFGEYVYYGTGRTRYDESAVTVSTVNGVTIVSEGGRVPTDDYDVQGHSFGVGFRLLF